MAKVMVSIDDDLLQRLDNYADNNYTTRSGAVVRAVNELLIREDVSEAVTRLSLAVQKIADNNNVVDENSKKEIEDIMNLARYFGASKVSA